jgi:hypothetical protein
MGFQVSPGVNVSEVDLTTIIPAVSTTTGAFAGHFRWGPVGQRVLLDSEDTLVSNFNKPNTNTYVDFLTAANFLAYGNALYTVRVVNEAGTAASDINRARNATTNSSNTSNCIIKNEDDYYNNYVNGISGVGNWVAKYPGHYGSSLRVSVCPSANAYESTITATGITATNNSTTLTISVSGSARTGRRIANSTVSNTVASAAATSIASANAILNGGSNTSSTRSKGLLTVGDILILGPDKIPVKVAAVGAVTTTTTTSISQAPNSGSSQAAIISAVDTSTFDVTLQSKYVGNTSTSTSVTRRWEYFDYAPSAPGTSVEVSRSGSTNDEMHVAILDEDGLFTGYANTIVEIYPNLSKALGAKNETGSDIYYKNYINKNSRYVWWAAALSGMTNVGRTHTTAGLDFSAGAVSKPLNASFSNGRDGAQPRSADYINGYNLFRNAETVDVSLILGGASTSTVAVHLINNIAEYRKDCIAVLSPRQADVVNNSGYSGAEVDDIVVFRNILPSSSYAVLDTGWKQQYDKYNDVFRFVPCNGDVAGTMVRTDIERDPWWSPAGYNRGQIKNVIKMAYNPGKADRDQLYKRGINPICTFPGEGTILFGDKTLLTKPSAFDRINVRRLFIVLEKAISTASKYTLFEFNDAFTRAQFKSMVEPFLRDVQGRRGITDFRVVCDESNNTGEIIDRNEFIGDIYIKPARSINFIQLNFVAVRTGVDFTEIVGKF